ncbi:unnamed protein product [Trichobilharzia szidati]|nr:unnamed protein product [Trichobilharzia szidati]
MALCNLIVVHFQILKELIYSFSLKHILSTSLLGLFLWYFVKSLLISYRLKTQLILKKANTSVGVKNIRKRLNNSHGDFDCLLHYVDKDLSELFNDVKSGHLDPVDLLHIFQAKALSLYDSGNSGIAEFIQEAEVYASELSKSRNDPTISPLFGIPISVKENCCVSGYDSTFGLIKRCNQPNTKDCILVQVLKRIGAIPFVTTVTTQLCRTLDSFNSVYGNAYNPLSKSRMPGGSSSGEAVLLALHGSPVGIGSDIGGSLRIPAAFCGLTSLKPTARRLSVSGLASAGGNSVLYLQQCPGPIGRKVEDLARVMRALLCPTMFDLDPYVVPMRFNEDLYGGKIKHKLVIGYYFDFDNPNIMPVVDVNRRVVEESVKALKKAGHQLVKFTVPQPFEAFILGIRAFFVDGGSQMKKNLKGEPVGRHLRSANHFVNLPNFLKPVVIFLSRYFAGIPEEIMRVMLGLGNAPAAVGLISEIKAYQMEFARAWNEAGPLDALICPVFAYPAPPENTPTSLISAPGIYTYLYNILDYPAGTVPIGFVSKKDVQDALVKSESLSAAGDDRMSKVYKLLDGGENMPLSIQVVGKPYHEEIVLRVMHDIENYFS